MADVASYAAATAANDVHTTSGSTLADLPKRIWTPREHSEHYEQAVFQFTADFTAITYKSGNNGVTLAAPREGDSLVHDTDVNAGGWRFVGGVWRQATPAVMADRPALLALDPFGKKYPTGSMINVIDDAGTGAREYICEGTLGAACSNVIPA